MACFKTYEARCMHGMLWYKAVSVPLVLWIQHWLNSWERVENWQQPGFPVTLALALAIILEKHTRTESVSTKSDMHSRWTSINHLNGSCKSTPQLGIEMFSINQWDLVQLHVCEQQRRCLLWKHYFGCILLSDSDVCGPESKEKAKLD